MKLHTFIFSPGWDSSGIPRRWDRWSAGRDPGTDSWSRATEPAGTEDTAAAVGEAALGSEGRCRGRRPGCSVAR